MIAASQVSWSTRLRRRGRDWVRYALSYTPQIFLPPLPGYRQALAELRESEYWSADQLRALADAKVRGLIAYVAQHVPYYKELFAREKLDPREIRGVSDLPKIPVLTREILRERFEDLKSDEFEKHAPVLGQSGGSTGERRQFWLSRRCMDLEFAAARRHYDAAGYRAGDRCAALYFPLEGALADRLYWDDWRSRTRSFNTRLLNKRNLQQFVSAAVAFRADVLWAYPSHLELFVRYVEETGDDRFLPRVVVSNAEVFYEHQREHARRVLGCDVFDWYGLGEHVAAAAECEHHGYHIPEEIVAVEVIAGGREAPDGEPGEIVGTCLENFAQPLIRYRTGDYAVRRHDRCACGRAHAMLREIGGRTQDIISTPDGGWKAFRHGLFGAELVPGLRAVQIEQLELQRFLVRAVAPQGLDEQARRTLARRVIEAIGFEASVEVILVDDIPRTERGKRRLVISRVPVSLLDASPAPLSARSDSA
ncbi:phenylacetate--CoA ligase family protein [Betaproteobacteria bacterium PRO7]|nr:phenylacetate--CoA ligase family protein [Betaproteobacteria bacterium PRO7]